MPQTECNHLFKEIVQKTLFLAMGIPNFNKFWHIPKLHEFLVHAFYKTTLYLFDSDCMYATSGNEHV